MKKDFDYYINLPYTTSTKLDKSDSDKPVWKALVKELPGCMTEADTWEEIHEMIHDAMAGWIEVRLQKGLHIRRTTTRFRV